MRVVLVDDHQIFREGLRAVLGAPGHGIEVVGEAADARQAYAIVEATAPSLVVLDVGLPGVDGIAVARELTRRTVASRVLILTMHVGREYVRQALGAGVSGYALKNEPAEDIVAAVRRVGSGGFYLSPRLPGDLRDALGSLLPPEPSSAGLLDSLSPRERDVFGLVVRGWSNEGVARELRISVKTVETHRSNINRKLGAHSTAELVRLAARAGLLLEK